MEFTIVIFSFMFGLGIGSYISGHSAYEEGISDERRKWYIHAHYWGWKKEDFKEIEHESKNHI